MKKRKQKNKDNNASLIGNEFSKNVQNASNASLEGMKLFETKLNSKIVKNGDFKQTKGNLFEYIEAAKFNREAALKNSTYNAEVTDVYDSHAAADILIKDNGKEVLQVQAKFTKTHDQYGKDTSASSNADHLAGKQKNHFGKYKGMQKLGRLEENYNGTGKSLNEVSIETAKQKAINDPTHAQDYLEASETMTDKLHYNEVSTQGTTYEEIIESYTNSEEYIKKFKQGSYNKETIDTAKNMAVANFVVTGIFSGMYDMFKVYRKEITLKEAIIDVSEQSTKSAIKGAATGIISSKIRQKATESNLKILSQSDASTILAGTIIDGGVSILSFALGEINSKELLDQLQETTCSSITSFFFSRGLTAITGGALNPIATIAIYTASSLITACTKEIIENAKLDIAQKSALISLYESETKEIERLNKEFDQYIKGCVGKTQDKFNSFIKDMRINLFSIKNYDKTVETIGDLADFLGIELQYLDFDDFKKALRNDEEFTF